MPSPTVNLMTTYLIHVSHEIKHKTVSLLTKCNNEYGVSYTLIKMKGIKRKSAK